MSIRYLKKHAALEGVVGVEDAETLAPATAQTCIIGLADKRKFVPKGGYDGRVVGSFAVPAGVPVGAHRITVVARTDDDKPATLTVGVMVGEWDNGPGVALWLIVLPIRLAIGGALVLPATRRRRRAA